MAKTFHNNPDKDVVRSQWDTPLLRELHNRFGVRYRYCGLPGVDLIDVLLWKDMIEEVIVFEPPDQSDSRLEAITALRRNMAVYGIRGQAFLGSFEEVVTLRKDFEGTTYRQDKIVTLYNLDFCNEIASKIDTSTQGRKCWRFHAIRQILSDQQNCHAQGDQPSWFVLMITVRNQMEASRLLRFLAPRGLSAVVRRYHDGCIAAQPLPERGPLIGTHTWALKAFLINTLSSYFVTPHLHALFFPCVLYSGTPVTTRDRRGRSQTLESPMLHLVSLCRFGDPEAAAPSQWPESFLELPSVQVQGNGLRWSPQTGERQIPGRPDVTRWLAEHGGELLNGL